MGMICLFALLQAGSVHAQLAAPLPTNADQTVRDEKLSEQQLKDFQTQTQERVAKFQEYLGVIADTDQPDPIREQAIENARKLFLDSAYMQVATLRNPKFATEYPLKVYLRNLKNLGKKYADVEITAYEPVVINGWEETKEGGFRTTATYFQKFKGFDKKGRLLYVDKTAKNVDVDLRRYASAYYEEHHWLVLLGNVSIKEVKPVR